MLLDTGNYITHVKTEDIQLQKMWKLKKKIRLQVSQRENTIIYPNNNKIDVKSFVENHKNLIKSNTIILKSQLIRSS